MKNCKKWLSALMLAAMLSLSALGASAQILPNASGSGANGMHTPAEGAMPRDGILPDRVDDMLPRDGKLPEAIDDMMPHVDDGVIHEGQAHDGRVTDGTRTPDAGTVIDDATDGGISGTVWGVVIAVGIAALAVLFIFLLMPKERDREKGGRRD